MAPGILHDRSSDSAAGVARRRWNGRICERPDSNSYCVGMHSYPGDVVARERDLNKEMAQAGMPLAKLGGADLPPCIYSINAFGPEPVRGYSNPPYFFRSVAQRKEWDIPEAGPESDPYDHTGGVELPPTRELATHVGADAGYVPGVF